MSEENKQPARDDAKAEQAKPEATTESKPDSSKAGESESVEVPTKFKKLVEEVEQMSILDLSELVKILEKKFGVSASAPVAVAAAGGVAGAETAEVKDSFDVELAAAGDNKIGAIKVVREVTGKGLKDAKDMVEAAPIVIKEGAKKEEAEEIKKKLEGVGAKVTLK
jgi:large subunit ribosomal protein L7/L12